MKIKKVRAKQNCKSCKKKLFLQISRPVGEEPLRISVTISHETCHEVAENREMLWSENISTAWKNIVGKTISQNTEIKSIKNGKVTIKTANPIWRNELVFQKEDLLNRLKKEEPELYIKDIEFR